MSETSETNGRIKNLNSGDMLSNGNNFMEVDLVLENSIVVFWSNNRDVPTYYPYNVFAMIVTIHGYVLVDKLEAS